MVARRLGPSPSFRWQIPFDLARHKIKSQNLTHPRTTTAKLMIDDVRSFVAAQQWKWATSTFSFVAAVSVSVATKDAETAATPSPPSPTPSAPIPSFLGAGMGFFAIFCGTFARLRSPFTLPLRSVPHSFQHWAVMIALFVYLYCVCGCIYNALRWGRFEVLNKEIWEHPDQAAARLSRFVQTVASGRTEARRRHASHVDQTNGTSNDSPPEPSGYWERS